MPSGPGGGKANCTHDGARPAREGLTVCEVITGSGSCGRLMTTRHHRSGQAAHEYSGSKADHHGTPTCRGGSLRPVLRRGACACGGSLC